MITEPIVTPLAIVLIGAFNLVYAGRLVSRSRRARRWPTVDGQVVSADLERRKQVFAQARWGLRVLYQYTAGAHNYTGAVISADGGPAFFSEELGRLAIAQRWRPGAAVKVHVNPRNPEDAMLAPRAPFWIHLMLVLGATITAAGVIELLTVIR